MSTSTEAKSTFFRDIGETVAAAADGDDVVDEGEAEGEGEQKGEGGEGEDEDGEREDNGITEMETLCMNCMEHGTTRMMLTLIPFFREVIIMSFDCDHCAFRNSEVQFGGMIQESGCRISAEILNAADLNRQMIKSDSSTISIPSLEFEIPPGTQRGSINTIEGILMKAVKDLQEDQAQRAEIDATTTAAIGNVLSEITLMATGLQFPFTIVIDDPAGNAFVENLVAPAKDPQLTVIAYDRTPAQDLSLGLQPSAADRERGMVDDTVAPSTAPRHDAGLDRLAFDSSANNAPKEVLNFPADCHNCHAPGETLMCLTDIPHFKEVIIMSFVCGACGFRSNEVKGGGAIPSYGERITLNITGNESRDFTRDVLKSDSASIAIPELEMEMEAGSLGGMYTTVEGLMKQIVANLVKGNPFFAGDSGVEHHGEKTMRSKFDRFVEQLRNLSSGTVPFTLILDDPLANSFIYSDCAPEPDPQLTVERYTRTFQQNDDMGLNDMRTESFIGVTAAEAMAKARSEVSAAAQADSGSGDENDEEEAKVAAVAGEMANGEVIASDKEVMARNPVVALRRCAGCNGIGAGMVKQDGYCDNCRVAGRVPGVPAIVVNHDDAAEAAGDSSQTVVNMPACLECSGFGVNLVKEDGYCDHCRRVRAAASTTDDSAVASSS